MAGWQRIGIIALLWCLAAIGAATVLRHAIQDHTMIHYNAELLEVVRRTVLELHPELVQP